MTRWATIPLAAILSAVMATVAPLPAGEAMAGSVAAEESLLLSEMPALSLTALEAENARGLDDRALSLQGRGNELGVILWDELKQGRPNGPQPQPLPVGQGMSTINATSNGR
ncbi:MAG: hypothetical protein RH942_10630 [Kiloniellaceae bacterium]